MKAKKNYKSIEEYLKKTKQYFFRKKLVFNIFMKSMGKNLSIVLKSILVYLGSLIF